MRPGFFRRQREEDLLEARTHRTHFQETQAVRNHGPGELAAHVAALLAVDLEADDRRAVRFATRVTPAIEASVGPASADPASTCTYIVSEPRSRAVRLSGVSIATTRPLLMMTTRSQVCDTSGRMCVLRMTVVAGELFDQLPRFDDLLGVEAGGGFVEDQDVGVVNQGLGEADALPVAFRQLLNTGGPPCR